jgi:hypothetical protein
MDDFHHLNKSADQMWLKAPGGLAANLDVFVPFTSSKFVSHDLQIPPASLLEPN